MSETKTGTKPVTERMEQVLEAVRENPNITISQIAEDFDISESTVKRAVKQLKENGMLGRIGPDKSGQWVILE